MIYSNFYEGMNKPMLRFCKPRCIIIFTIFLIFNFLVPNFACKNSTKKTNQETDEDTADLDGDSSEINLDSDVAEIELNELDQFSEEESILDEQEEIFESEKDDEYNQENKIDSENILDRNDEDILLGEDFFEASELDGEEEAGEEGQFLTTSKCNGTTPCSQDQYCIKRDDSEYGVCAFICDVGNNCPNKICGAACPPQQSCNCSDGSICSWETFEPFPKCKQPCQPNNVYLTCENTEVCFHSLFPDPGSFSVGVCVQAVTDGSNGCPIGTAAAGELFKGNCFANTIANCNIKCPSGYGCYNLAKCGVFCPSPNSCPGRTTCTWDSAPYCIEATCKEMMVQCSSSTDPCCDGQRCCATSESSETGACMPQKDCFSGKFLDPY